MRLEELDQSHDRKGFDCGEEPLNFYIQQVARQHAKRGVSRVFVLVEDGAVTPKPIVGFFSLAACEAEGTSLPESLARRLPRKIPAVRLGRLAVAQAYQGQGWGRDLVLLALEKTVEGATRVGVTGLFVDAKNAGVAKFYGKFGFQALPDQTLTLFLPIQTARRLIGGAEPK